MTKLFTIYNDLQRRLQMSTLNTLNSPQKAGVRESRYNTSLATLSIAYLLLLLAFFFWLLFDTWIGKNSIPGLARYTIPTDARVYRLVAFTMLGGGLGGVINGLRSFLQHGSVFDGRFTWKYITLPWLGTTNALFVYALISSGLSVFGSSGATAGAQPSQIIAMFSVGVLAGYGSRDVFLWLDAQVTKLFKYEVMVPNLRYQSVEQAEKNLHKAQLQLGLIIEEERAGMPASGKVIRQEPESGSIIERGTAVAITLAVPPLSIGASPIVNGHNQLLAEPAPPPNGLVAHQPDHIPQPAAAGLG
jgi:hypothetical protein